MIAERTRDKMAAARRKGKWIGGCPPLGYDVAPGGGKLVINEGEAEQVRAIFGLYLEHRSLLRVVELLNARGWRTKSWLTQSGKRHEGARWEKAALRKLRRRRDMVELVVGRLEGGRLRRVEALKRFASG